MLGWVVGEGVGGGGESDAMGEYSEGAKARLDNKGVLSGLGTKQGEGREQFRQRAAVC